MKIRNLITILLSVVFISACSILDSGDQIKLSGTSWKLTSFDGIKPIDGRDITARFEKDQINGSSGCNQYFGSYKVKGDQITIESLGWTEMACLDPEGLMEQEATVMMMFSHAEKITRRNSSLQILTSQGEILLFELIASE
jgi:heat shock protein HslJ